MHRNLANLWLVGSACHMLVSSSSHCKQEQEEGAKPGSPGSPPMP